MSMPHETPNDAENSRFRFVSQSPGNANVSRNRFILPSPANSDVSPVRFVPPFPDVSRNRFVPLSFPESFEGSQISSCAEIVGSPTGAAGGVKVKGGQWTMQEREMLLDWLANNLTNIADLKTHFRSTCTKISVEVFAGARTADGIKGQWEGMKRKYQRAKERLQSTGEGQREDEEKWASIKLGWLNQLCPFYEQIDDILRRDKSVTPLYISEVGGEEGMEFVEGVRQQDVSVVSEIDWVASDLEEDDDVHPPAGGSKLPVRKDDRKKGETKGIGAGALKKRKASAMEDKFDSIHKQRMAFEEKKLIYEKERDERSFALMKQKEDNRHEESLIRLRLMEQKTALLLAQMEKNSK